MQKIYSVCDIHSPKQIQEMSLEELNHLAKEIRTFLIESISKTGGHLSSNLGIVEVTLAMHGSLTLPKIIDFHISPLNGLFLLLF